MDSNSTDSRIKLLIAATGSVAALKIPTLINRLLEIGKFEIRLMYTQKSTHFFELSELQSVTCLRDEDEWECWKNRGDPVLHIDAGKWADVMLIAPLDANTMAKLSNGICDNLVTCTVRAWDISKPLYFCPAMNTKMYKHPLTSMQINIMKSWGYREIPVVSKTLICGDTGEGAMAEVDTIIEAVCNFTL